MPTDISSIEKTISNQILDIERRIRDLQQEKHALERLLLQARRDDVLTRDVTRKNSVNRILVENKIFEVLGSLKKPLSNSELYRATSFVVENLNKNTFRSHTKRLKDAGKLVSRNGKWELPKSSN